MDSLWLVAGTGEREDEPGKSLFGLPGSLLPKSPQGASLIRARTRPNPLPGMMTPANQPATRPMIIQATRPPGFKAAANTSVASDMLSPFFVQKQPCISGPPGALQLKFLWETPDQQCF